MWRNSVQRQATYAQCHVPRYSLSPVGTHISREISANDVNEGQMRVFETDGTEVSVA